MLILAYESNHDTIIAEMMQLSSALPRAVNAGKFNVAELILKSTRRVMRERIYDQPLPLSYIRAGKTYRTGALMAGEVMLASDDGFLITTQNRGVPRPHRFEADKNPEDYSEWRHFASGVDWISGEWRDLGVEAVESLIEPTFWEGMSRTIPGALLSPG